MSKSPAIRVVLADDHPVVRGGIREALGQDAGITIVGEASSGDEAVALCQSEKPEVALFDIRMPPTSGIEAMRQVVQTCPDTRVIILTVHDTEPYWDKARRAGASGFINKHAPMEQLHAAVRAVASGGTFFSAEMTRRLAERETGVYSVNGELLTALSDVELETLRAAADGSTNAEIAEKLDTKEEAIKSRLRSIYQKLRVHGRTAAIHLATKQGWIDPTANEVILSSKSKRVP
jgi:DNA-binding NarL/FixJ family response regulator